jgi:endogenous inhibitor of DNA gyrase (YacG/DUF329 family)
MAERSCPICKQPADTDRQKNPYAPFCSRRCKTIDLGRWLGEAYRLPVEEETPSDPEGNVPPRGEGGEG